MDELPADAVVTADCARISPGDAMSDRADPAELLDIDVDEFTRHLTFMARTGSARSKALAHGFIG